MNRRTNSTNHFAFDFEDGETFTDSAKNTVGGWANMMKRVEARTGGTVRPADESGTRWTVNGRSFTVTQVWKV